MHNKNILHRDIKSDNILCSPDGRVKLADLGLSVFLSEQQQYRDTRRGTPSWFSPEIARGIHYAKEVDIWAYGCLAYELLTSEPPHYDITDMEMLFKAIIEKDVQPIDDKWSEEMADFVKQCLNRDAKKRWTIN